MKTKEFDNTEVLKLVSTIYQVYKDNSVFQIVHPITGNKIIGGFEDCITIMALEVGIPIDDLIEGLKEIEIEQKRLKALREDGYY